MEILLSSLQRSLKLQMIMDRHCIYFLAPELAFHMSFINSLLQVLYFLACAFQTCCTDYMVIYDTYAQCPITKCHRLVSFIHVVLSQAIDWTDQNLASVLGNQIYIDYLLVLPKKTQK